MRGLHFNDEDFDKFIEEAKRGKSEWGEAINRCLSPTILMALKYLLNLI
jgi:hypothetical protein